MGGENLKLHIFSAELEAALDADVEKVIKVGCPKGTIPVGEGFEEPDAGRPGVSSRLVAQDVKGRKVTTTIENTGTASFETKQIAVCADTDVEVKGHDAELQTKSVPASVTVQPNGEGFLGQPCPRKLGGIIVIGATGTDFGPLGDNIFGLLNAPGTRYEEPTRIINGAPGPETVKGETNCLGYEVL
jgi:hypothetical protein